MARIIAGIALVLALAAAGYLIFADTYAGSSCRITSDGVQHCVDTSATLIEENGTWVLWLLAVPVVLAAAQLVLVLAEAPPVISGLIAAMFLGLCIITVFTIGFMFLPAALLSAVAGALRYGRGRSQPV